MTYKKKLVEVALPLAAINRESAREKSIRFGHPSTLHLWWARRPLLSARAIIWASLVDDPSSVPDRFPTEEAQEAERRRLFQILEELAKWENSNNQRVLTAARREIEKSCDGETPAVLDPFCGGGTIPLEAQRLGLRAFGGDLNPVAVLISKAMVEIPPLFADCPPVHPFEATENLNLRSWERAQGLAEDVRYYGKWMRDRAHEAIGALYPPVPVESGQISYKGEVVAWVWARTVQSPDPSWEGHVPLVKSWVLRKPGRGRSAVWIEPKVDHKKGTVSYQIREGTSAPAGGTVRRARGTCIATGTPIPDDYIKAQGVAGELREELIAIVVGGPKGRVFVEPTESQSMLANSVERPARVPSILLSTHPQYMGPPKYGFGRSQDLFTARQLLSISTFADLVQKASEVALQHALNAGLTDDSVELADGGSGALAYAQSIQTYLAFGVSRLADINNAFCMWESSRTQVRHMFTRQAIPMLWDFAETNVFGSAAGGFLVSLESVARALEKLPAGTGACEIAQRDAAARVSETGPCVLCTDPPYYDNVPYADISDFFFVWLRQMLKQLWPKEFSTITTPKAEELVADTQRHNGKEAAQGFFEDGMRRVFEAVSKCQIPDFPATVFYAFKQTETNDEGVASTGWESFLQGLLEADFTIVATWPIRTELMNRPRAMSSGALASSIVIAIRPAPSDRPLATRSEFLAALRTELPRAVKTLQLEAIAPVDLAQSAIGPGMAVFSRFSRVVEADGSAMTVRTALSLINESLREVLSEEETEFDGDTRWALTWFEQHGLNPGRYGDAETLSKAKDTSVLGVVSAGIVESRDGKVRLFDRDELDPTWDPKTDRRLTVWEVTQHLIRKMNMSEVDAAELLRQIGPGLGERARQLAYLLYGICERKDWAKEAVSYNGLIVAWPELTRLAAVTSGAPVQQTLGDEEWQ